MAPIPQEVIQFLVALSAFSALLAAYLVFHYIAVGFGCFRMMRKAGMTNAWMAWVPYCNTYALGDLADHYNLLCEGKDTAYAKKLLAWHIVTSVLSYPVTILIGAVDVEASLRDVSADFWLLFPAYAAFLVVYAVFYCIALCKVYRLFAPASAAGLTVLSILVPVAVPVILLVISKREPHLPFAVETETPPAPPAGTDTGYYSF